MSNFGPDLCATCSSAYSALNTRKSCPRCHQEGCVRCVKHSLTGSSLRVCADCSSSNLSSADKPSIHESIAPTPTKKPYPSIFDSLSSPTHPPTGSSPGAHDIRHQRKSSATLPTLKSDSDDEDKSSSSSEEEENPFSFFKSNGTRPIPKANDPEQPPPPSVRRAALGPDLRTAPSLASLPSPDTKRRVVPGGPRVAQISLPSMEEDEEEEEEEVDEGMLPALPRSGGGLASLPSVENVSSRIPPRHASTVDSGGDSGSALVALAAKVTQLQTALDASSDKAKRVEEMYNREKRTAEKLQVELAAVKKKEAEDTKAMETMLQAVEQNLVNSQKRAVLAEKQLQELDAKYQALLQAHQHCSTRSHDPEAQQRLENMQHTSAHVAERLVSMHSDFASAMSLLLSHAKEFKELADITSSIGRTTDLPS